MKKIITIIIVTAAIIFAVGFTYFKIVENKNLSKITKNLEEAKKIYEAIPVWHKKIKTQQDLKIGIISDTHVHAKRINRNDKRDEAPRYLPTKDIAPINNFVADMQSFKPEFVVHLGDVIEGTNDKDYVGLSGIKLVKEELEKIGVPLYWVLGNHDLRSVTKDQFKNALNLESLNQVFDSGDYRFVILDANFNPKKGGYPGPTGNKFIPGFVSPEGIKWLKKQLATDKHTFVFVHQGPYSKKLKGDEKKSDIDEYDEDDDDSNKKFKMKQPIANSQELRDIFKEYRVDGVFNGHMEARYYEKDGFTSYYSFTGTKKSEDYPDSYYELTITDSVPDITMYYLPKEETQIKKVDFESGKK